MNVTLFEKKSRDIFREKTWDGFREKNRDIFARKTFLFLSEACVHLTTHRLRQTAGLASCALGPNTPSMALPRYVVEGDVLPINFATID